MIIKIASRYLARIILLIACFSGSLAGTTTIVRAATPATLYGTFGNYYIQAVNHIAPNAYDYYNNVVYGVSNWDTVVYWPSWTLTDNTNSGAPGNVHFWQRDYRTVYLNAVWLGSTELFAWSSGVLISCNPPPYFYLEWSLRHRHRHRRASSLCTHPSEHLLNRLEWNTPSELSWERLPGMRLGTCLGWIILSATHGMQAS